MLSNEEITGKFIHYINQSLHWRKINFYSKYGKSKERSIFESIEEHEEMGNTITPKGSYSLLDDFIHQKLDIAIAFNQLTDREQYILKQKLFLDRTDARIAQELKVSSQYISRQKRQALQKLKNLLSDKPNFEERN
ncbi:sigma factor-like helix-turn-helix DNA-binding protein [Enterococcus termitis]|uniref:RNA polymerase sigma-70 region 4 domain-containing protein n=1 Tax=Enterococcus termitis TaxID=332950 RepID=A0A1E5H0L3_9ENTE|nr:sigma factor-like helix-turn-helix DNA-binding protein [Enterococcus termitis]ECB9820383.1 hypothetical protein [Listeria monocytogenes]ECB9834699.1 hypothetical protein [Listeria monocytogenes]OEG18436.1 hypothetical protein BCR25_16565 [Enterococcus termitis]OJG96582.1 hypothetical protein RV18_GL002088 [Enterococcus termitis]